LQSKYLRPWLVVTKDPYNRPAVGYATTEVIYMSGKRLSRSEKYNNIVLNYNFPQTEGQQNLLPYPSLEDVRDSEKNDYFSIP